MASLQEIQAAFASFNQGLRQLQQGRLIRKANNAVDQIRQSEMNDGEKQAALQDIARGVATGFVSMGGDVKSGVALGRTIAGAQEQDTPSSIFEAFARGGQARETALQYMGVQEEAKVRASQRTEDRQDRQAAVRQQRSRLNKTRDQYFSASRQLDQTLNFARNAQRILNTDDPNLEAVAKGPLEMMLARAAGSSAQLSDREAMLNRGAQDYYTQLRQAIKTGAAGTWLEDNKEGLKKLVDEYVNSAQDLKQDYASTLAGQLYYNEFPDADPNKLVLQITGGQVKEFNPENKLTNTPMSGESQPVSNPFSKGFVPNQ